MKTKCKPACIRTCDGHVFSSRSRMLALNSFVGKLLLFFFSSSDPYLASWFFPFYSKPQALHRIWNWNHLMPCIIICVILYLPSPQRRGAGSENFADVIIYSCQLLFMVAARCRDPDLCVAVFFIYLFIFNAYFMHGNFLAQIEVGSPFITFISKRGSVSVPERWGLCICTEWTHTLSLHTL